MAKDDFIKARVTKEDKLRLKRIAKENNMDLSEMMLKAILKYADHLDFNYKHQADINKRCNQTDSKLLALKEKLKNIRK